MLRSVVFLGSLSLACSAELDITLGPDAGGDVVLDVTLDNATLDAAAQDGADAGPCPATMAHVVTEAGAFCVDLFEGAIATKDGGVWPHGKPVDGVDASDLLAIPADHLTPQGYISQVQAQAACARSGKRLCTLPEWTAACRGRPSHDYVYPYGNAYQSGTCNEGKPSPIVTLFGPNPTYSNQELNDPRCDELEGGLAKGGEYAKCVSSYGAFDMHGNLHEWIDDSPNGDVTRGSFMGGFFVDAKLNGPGCTYRTTAHAKTYHDYSTGFRCCKDAL